MTLNAFISAHQDVQFAKHGKDFVHIGRDPAYRWWAFTGNVAEPLKSSTVEKAQVEAHRLKHVGRPCSLKLAWKKVG
jgi:hypothetical protein